jgi:transcriptional regulator with XRE-family HTH domain
MITSTQMRAARALLGIDQRQLALRSGLSLPTIQRMEASDGVIRGNVDSLMKLVGALAANGIELIGEGSASTSGGRGVRLKEAATS